MPALSTHYTWTQSFSEEDILTFAIEKIVYRKSLLTKIETTQGAGAKKVKAADQQKIIDEWIGQLRQRYKITLFEY